MTHTNWSNDNAAAHGIDGAQPTRRTTGHGVWYFTPADRLELCNIRAIADDGSHQAETWVLIPCRRWCDPVAAEINKAIEAWLEELYEEAPELPEDLHVDLKFSRGFHPGNIRRWGGAHRSGWFEFGTYHLAELEEPADEYLLHCEDCNELIWQAHSIRTAYGDTVGDGESCNCADNFTSCSDCGDYYHETDIYTVEGEAVCRHCIERGDYYWYEDAGEYRTEPPASDPLDGAMPQYGYHTDPNSTLDWEIPDSNHLYGIEMEFLGSPDDPEGLADACEGHAILTEDGTVDGELVSVAMTAGEARAYLRRMVPALAGTTNSGKVGLHVHISRTALSPAQWFRLAQFCARNVETLETIGGRHSNQWHNLRQLPATDAQSFMDAWTRNNGIMGDRYAGMNFRKRPTIEFRHNRATHTLSRALARFGAIQRIVALGRLDTDAMPDQEQLRGWLAEDPHIQRETGWMPGLWQYPGKVRDQTQQHEHQGPTGPDQIAA